MLLLVGSAGVFVAPLDAQHLPKDVATAVREHDPLHSEERKRARARALEQRALISGDWRVGYWATYVARFSASDSTNVAGWAEQSLSALSTLLTHKDTLRGSARSHVESLESLVYDLVAFSMRAEGDTLDGVQEEYERLRDQRLQEALTSDPANPVALVMAGMSLIVDGRRSGDRRTVLAGCALQTRGLALRPTPDLGALPDFTVRWAREGRVRVREELGPGAARVCEADGT